MDQVNTSGAKFTMGTKKQIIYTQNQTDQDISQRLLGNANANGFLGIGELIFVVPAVLCTMDRA
jgi:hypothetical protein